MYSLKNSIIGAALLATLFVGFAPSAEAQSVITQQTTAVSNDLPRDAFYPQVNNAINELSVEDIPAIIAQLNAWASQTGGVAVLSIASRRPVLGANNTNFFVIDRGTGTNGQVVTFTTAFSATPQVFVDYVTYVATNSPAGPSAATPTNVTLNGTATLSLNWVAVGPK